MQIDDKLYEELMAYLGRRPLAEVYTLYSRLVMAKVKKPEITNPATVDLEENNG